MKKLWAFLNGNKTVIGLFLLQIMGTTYFKNLIPAEIINIIRSGIMLLTGASAAHHIQKGFFTTKKGV